VGKQAGLVHSNVELAARAIGGRGGSPAGGVEEEEGSPTGSFGGGAPKSKGGTKGDENRHSSLAKPGSAKTPELGVSSKPPN